MQPIRGIIKVKVALCADESRLTCYSVIGDGAGGDIEISAISRPFLALLISLIMDWSSMEHHVRSPLRLRKLSTLDTKSWKILRSCKGGVKGRMKMPKSPTELGGSDLFSRDSGD